MSDQEHPRHDFLPADQLNLSTVTSRWRLAVIQEMTNRLMVSENFTSSGLDSSSVGFLFRLDRGSVPHVRGNTSLVTGYTQRAHIDYCRTQLDYAHAPSMITPHDLSRYSIMHFRVGKIRTDGPKFEDPWSDLEYHNPRFPDLFFLAESRISEEEVAGADCPPTQYFLRALFVRDASAHSLDPKAVFARLDLKHTLEHNARETGQCLLNRATMSGLGHSLILRHWNNLFTWSDPLQPQRSSRS